MKKIGGLKMNMNIGQTIARLRKQAQMTQEDLAEAIGVSSQSISKWETGSTYPDILLLPVIADTLNVSIDCLFGRKDNVQSNEDFFTSMEEVFLDKLYTYFCDGDDDKYEADGRRKYKEALKQDFRMNSAIIRRGKGIMFYNATVGTAVLKAPQGGWVSLFDEYETGILPLLERLADSSFASLMKTILSKEDYSFTVNSAARQASLAPEVVKGHLEYLSSENILDVKHLDLDEEGVMVYGVNPESKLIPLLAVLSWANFYRNYQSIYRGYFGDGRFYIHC